jgi:hypothetical protein
MTNASALSEKKPPLVYLICASRKKIAKTKEAKGQLISKYPFGVFKIDQKTNKIFVRISALTVC